MITFYVIRHPETEWNLQQISQGWKDSKLTGYGRKIAEYMGRKLKKYGIKHIYTSDLGRCVETANIVNVALELPITEVEALREQNLGEDNGQPKKLIDGVPIEDVDLDRRPEGGENFWDVHDRVTQFIQNAQDLDNALLIVHGGSFNAILAESSNTQPSELHNKHTAKTLAIFEQDGKSLELVKFEEL